MGELDHVLPEPLRPALLDAESEGEVVENCVV
jgi:hypothetical protein